MKQTVIWLWFNLKLNSTFPGPWLSAIAVEAKKSLSKSCCDATDFISVKK